MRHDFRFNWRGFIGGLILIPITGFVLFSEPLVQEGSWADAAIDALAYATFVAGAIFRFWSTLHIGGRKEQAVICEGPYSICRNPLYVGSFLLAVSIGFFFMSVLFAAGLGLTILFYMLATVPAEERVLRGLFGTAYDEYCRKVPRFWPRFSQLSSSPTVEVQMQGLKREAKRALVWLWIPVIGELIAQLRGAAWWPHWFTLP